MEKESASRQTALKLPVSSLKPGKRSLPSRILHSETFVHRQIGNSVAARDSTGEPFVQAKLKIGAANDYYEREADRVADQVVSMSLPSAPPDDLHSSGKSIQRKCNSCEREDELLQRKENTAAAGKPAGANVSDISLSGGAPLNSATRSYFEPRFGVDFSGVRLHTGKRAQSLTGEFNARAFTYGNNIAFADGEFNPDSTHGRRLLAHELTHVVQQSGGQKQISRSMKDSKVPLIPRITAVSRRYLQRVTATCRRLLRRGFLSSIAIGNAVEDEIQRDFERRLGPRYIFDVESGTSAPYSASPTVRPPSLYGAARFGVGSPDIAYKSRTGAAMLVAEIKPANWPGLLLAESQLANYIVKGNAPENAELRSRLGVRTITPMTGRGRFRTPRFVTALGERYRVVWCGPGVILYSPVSKKKKKKKTKKKTKKKSGSKKKTTKKRTSKKKLSKKKSGARRAGSAGAFNFGLGISIGSFGVGAGNVGVGVSIFSEGASVGTVSAGVAYNSMGAALGAVGAGASVDSESAGAGVAGAGLTDESSTAAAGAAGAGRSSGNTVAGAGVAGAGSVSDTTGAAAGRAGSGTVEGGRAGDSSARPGVEGAREGTGGGVEGGTEREGTGAGVEGGTAREGGAGGTGGAARGTAGGRETGTGTGTGTGGGSDRGDVAGGSVAADARLAQIVAQLQLESPEITDAAGLTRALADAARLDQLVQNATPAQRILLQALARNTETGTYHLPSPDWALMMLEATQGISEEDLEYLMQLDWQPANITLEELRQSILAALARRRADTPPPPATPTPPPPVTEAATPPPETAPAEETAPPPASTGKKKTKKKASKKKRRRRRGGGSESGGRRSRFASVSASTIATALRSLDWSGIGPGDVRINLDRGIFYARTENGTRYGAFITVGEREHEGVQVTVINDASDIVAIDETQSGDGISLLYSDGTSAFTFFAGVSFGSTASSVDSVVSDGGILLGLQLSD